MTARIQDVDRLPGKTVSDHEIDRRDQATRTDNASYASQVPEGDAPPQKVSND